MQRGKRTLALGLLWGFAFCLVLIGLSGCSVALRLYPVQGPLAAVAPAPVYVGKFSVYKNFHSGTVKAVMDGGETFRGTLTLVRNNPKKAPGAADGAPPMADGMKAAWDSVYGDGYYVAHVLGGVQYGRASLIGSKGTTLQMEIHNTESGQAKGVAKDDKGNLYKVVFGPG